jgi:hypothetical protein
VSERDQVCVDDPVSLLDEMRDRMPTRLAATTSEEDSHLTEGTYSRLERDNLVRSLRQKLPIRSVFASALSPLRRMTVSSGAPVTSWSRQSRWRREAIVSLRSCCRRRRNDRSDSLVLHSIERSSAAAASSRRSSRANTSARAVWKYT